MRSQVLGFGSEEDIFKITFDQSEGSYRHHHANKRFHSFINFYPIKMYNLFDFDHLYLYSMIWDITEQNYKHCI